LTKTGNNLLHECFKNSLIIISVLQALLFFKHLIASSTSYWSLLNTTVSSNDKQKIIDKVSIDCFVDHLKKLDRYC